MKSTVWCNESLDGMVHALWLLVAVADLTACSGATSPPISSLSADSGSDASDAAMDSGSVATHEAGAVDSSTAGAPEAGAMESGSGETHEAGSDAGTMDSGSVEDHEAGADANLTDSATPAEGGDATTGPPSCNTGYTLCGTSCVNEQIDSNNCGGCGLSCQGATCECGSCETPTTLAANQGAPQALAVDSNNVYWLNYDTSGETGTVMRCAVNGCGGNPTTLVSSQFEPQAIAVDSTAVYWTEGGGNGGVMSCAIGGCGDAPTVIASNCGAACGAPTGIAVDSTSVYWTNLNYGYTVVRCAKSGCGNNPTVLASLQNEPDYIVVDSTNAYWTDQTSSGLVMQCAVGGCSNNPTALASQQNNPAGIAVDSTSVYWTEPLAGLVMTCAIGGCSGSPTTLASAQYSAEGIAVDSTNVYWINNGVPGTVMMCAKGGCGGNPTVLASGQANPYQIAVDSTSVYWTNAGGNFNTGSVMKVAKPACTAPCVPGSVQCDGNTPQACNSGGQWVSGTTCPATCSSGQCTGINALSFSGTAQVTVPNSTLLDLGTAATVEAWFYVVSFGGEVILDKWTNGAEDKFLGFADATQEPPTAWFYYPGEPDQGSDSESASTTPTAMAWHHVAATLGNGTLTLFVDGVATGSGAYAASIANSTGPLNIGGLMRDGAWHPPINGYIADVRVSSTDKYTANFTPSATLPVEADTLALWHLNEETGTVANDSGPYGLTGTIVGTAQWITAPARP